MANNYLVHYGVKKSQWSQEARSRYDAEHRRRYGAPEVTIRPDRLQTNQQIRGNHVTQNTGSQQVNVGRTGRGTRFRRYTGKTASIDSRGPISTAQRRVGGKKVTQDTGRKALSKDMRSVVEGYYKSTSRRTGKSVTQETTGGRRQTRNDRKNFGRSSIQDTTYGDSVRDAGSGTNKRVGASVVGKKKSTTASGRMNGSGSTVRDNKRVTLASGSGKRLGQRIQNGRSAIGETLAERSKFTNASLPKAGFIFKRPQARTVGKDLYKATKKEAHKVKKQNDAAKKEAQDAFERHKREAERSYAKQQEAKAKKKAAEKKRKEKEDKKAVDAYNRNLKRNDRYYNRFKEVDTDFWGNKRVRTYKEVKKSKNPFDRLATSYVPIKTSDNKLVRGLKKAYNSLGYNYNVSKEDQRAYEKRYREREKEKKRKQKEYEKQQKAQQKSK